MAEGTESDTSATDDDRTDSEEKPTSAQQGRWRSEVRLAVAVYAVVAVVVAGLAGWMSYAAWRSHHAEQERDLFLGVARQSAQDMTTISYTEVDSDVQRILDLSIGSFHEDFANRRQPFIDHITHERSISRGTVAEAGLESFGDNSARALVSVSVKLSKGVSGEQKLDGFRLRLDLQRVGAGAKVSDVEYVQ